jgi:SAM-dependent methyltransferase
VGCWDYSFHRQCESIGVTGLKHSGIDRERAWQPVPKGYSFAQVDLDRGRFPFPAESFDAVVASHVLEHLTDQLKVMDEIFRVLKGGGLLYLECPSDRSLRLPSMPFRHEEFRSLNFFDDPTHVGRPHTPQSLYRLFKMYGAEVIESRYLVSGRVRLALPKTLLLALIRRDAANLEHAIWWTFGFAVYGIARKTEAADRHYKLNSAIETVDT